MSIVIHKNFKLNGHSFLNREELLSFSKTISSEAALFLTQFLDDNSSVKLQTSGSTGTPKVIEVKKEFMINSAKATGMYFRLGANTTALLCMNLNYVGGKMMLVRALVLGWQLDVIAPRSNPLKILNTSYDFCAMVPLQVIESKDLLYKIKILIIGGGLISEALKSSLQSIKTNCFATYGMTETVSHIALRKLNNFKETISNEVEESHYNVLDDISILKDNRNCLIIDAPRIAANMIITNDIVEIVSTTAFKWLGRYDNVINSGGVKLIPEQIEKKLSEIISKRFFVSGIPDAVLGEKLILIIEGEIRVDVVRNKVKNLGSLKKYEIPKEIYFTSNFAETQTGKIHRNKSLKMVFNN